MAGSFSQGLSKRIVDPILAQLRQGITPEKLALSLALGAVWGVFPVLGISTFACLFLGAALRLNQPILQLANYTVAFIQVPLAIVFLRLGEQIWGAPTLPFDYEIMMAAFQASPLGFFQQFGLSMLHAISAWLLTAPVVLMLLYPTFLWGLRRLARLKVVAQQAPGEYQTTSSRISS